MANFIYYNINPEGEEVDDCVTRAIALATNTPYKDVSKKLYLTSQLIDCDELCVCCYNFLIENVYGGKKIDCTDLTVGEFADIYPYGIYLVRIEGHLTTIINNNIYDIWDCRGELCDKVWQM